MTKQELQVIIGQNLHTLRTERGLTREELAEKVGISPTFYANLERGKKMMSMVTLRKLADVLCVSTDSILFEDRPSDQIAGIQMALRDQPKPVLSFVERMVQLCIDHAKTQTDEEGAGLQ